jgi:hypothetical protein
MIIFALLLLKRVEIKSQRLTLFVIALIALGISSHLAHASFTEFALAMDFAGIILVTSFFPVIRLIERWTKSLGVTLLILLVYSFGVWNIFYSMDKWYKIGLCVIAFIFAMAELIKSEGRAFLKARQLHKAIGILILSFGFFLMDELKIFCSPESLLQGHSVWHLGTASSLYLYGQWRFRSST